jgi:opine dehydrogenase
VAGGVEMKVTVIGAGNSGLAMAAHLSKEGNNVTLWNRSKSTIDKLLKTHVIYCEGIINSGIPVNSITNDLEKAVEDPDVILITTPADSHKELAERIAKSIKRETLIVLNPGRTFGALEFNDIYSKYNKKFKQIIAETQTIIYTCRRTGEDSVNIITLKSGVLISAIDADKNKSIISMLPECVQQYFIPARSMIETSIGNVGMILHCAPLLLNAGWTESESNVYKYYYDGITPSVGNFIEKIDEERVLVSKMLGLEVETTQAWLKRTYDTHGNSLYQCIQNNEAYKTIDAPCSLKHRYIFEDVPCGLVPLETVGKRLGLEMKYTGLIIDLASSLMDVDFRSIGRNLNSFFDNNSNSDFRMFFFRSGE